MGRFTSVQAFSDNNQAIRKVTYEQAAATPNSSDANDTKGFVKPEKVVNPYGSTAGAGSGEFHLYRHGRNREIQRVKQMEAEEARNSADQKFLQQKEDNEKWENERTAKRRKKRERQKEAKRRKQNLAKAGIDMKSIPEDSSGIPDEFEYVPGSAIEPVVMEAEEPQDSDDGAKPQDAAAKEPSAEAKLEIRNDGSFLETMKKALDKQEVPTT